MNCISYARCLPGIPCTPLCFTLAPPLGGHPAAWAWEGWTPVTQLADSGLPAVQDQGRPAWILRPAFMLPAQR